MPTIKKDEKKVQDVPAVADTSLLNAGKYEVTSNSTFTVKLNLFLQDGRWMVVDRDMKGSDHHEVVFRMWTFDEAIEFRKKATSLHAETRQQLLDDDHLNEIKVRKLMQSWTFDRENSRLKIHRVGGVLTDESLEIIKKLQENILRYIHLQMNVVLERGM